MSLMDEVKSEMGSLSSILAPLGARLGAELVALAEDPAKRREAEKSLEATLGAVIAFAPEGTPLFEACSAALSVLRKVEAIDPANAGA
jgi:hypothetical protein